MNRQLQRTLAPALSALALLGGSATTSRAVRADHHDAAVSVRHAAAELGGSRRTDALQADLGRAVTVAPTRQTRAHAASTRAVAGPTVARAAVTINRNWAGEAIRTRTPGTFQGAFGTWHVPRTTTSPTAKAASTWVGVDGANNARLIQTGTEGDYLNGRTAYHAWVDFPPQAEELIAYPDGHLVPVRPGDSMKAYVAETATPHVWKVFLQDLTQGWTFATTRHYSGPGTSAEWIQEATMVNGTISPMPAFAPVTFQHLEVAVSGRWHYTTLTGANALAVVQRRQLKAYPAGLTNSTPQQFSVLYKR